jgi:hypothetical protein
MSRLAKILAITGLLFTALVLINFLPGYAAVPATMLPTDEDTVLTLNPSPATVTPGSTFTLTVQLDTIPASRAAQFGISFDPAVLECVSVSEGTFYSDWAGQHAGSTFVFPEPECDNVNGIVTMMGITVLSSEPGGPTGTGDVASVVFTTIGEGSSELVFSDVLIADDSMFESKALPVTVYDGLVNVQGESHLFLPMIVKP